jgi:hypothetical protein
MDQVGILLHEGSPALKLKKTPHGQSQSADRAETFAALPKPSDVATDILALSADLASSYDAQLAILVLPPPRLSTNTKIFQYVGRFRSLAELLLDAMEKVCFLGPGGLPTSAPEPGQGWNRLGRNT